MGNPWDDPSLKSEATKKIEAGTAALKKGKRKKKKKKAKAGPTPGGPGSMAEDIHDEIVKRNEGVAKATGNYVARKKKKKR